MTKDTKLSELVINKLTKTQYDGIATKDPNQLYIVTDAPGFEESRTNCITEIPQDIKLELNNGTLTLKAGSKIYVPNGAGKFDVVNVTSDVVFHSGTVGTATFNAILCCNLTGGYGIRAALDYFVSGATAPTNTNRIWYDTTNNMIKAYENGAWVQKYSLPIGIYVRTNGVATSIDQIFNGFGYIGSTVFALPGVKGLIPNGRNADGTLKNIEHTLPKVITFERNLTGNEIPVWIRNNNTLAISTGLSYDEINNIVGTGGYFQVGSIDMNAGVISSFQSKTPFHAVDYNDFKKLDDEAVRRTGDKTIDGDTTFTTSLNVKNSFADTTVYMRNTNDDITQTPTAQQTRGYRVIDKNGKILGDVRFQSTTSGQRKTSLMTRNGISGTETSAFIDVVVEKNGVSYGVAPTVTDVNDNSRKIATTGWFNKKCQVVSALPASPTSGVYYFVKE